MFPIVHARKRKNNAILRMKFSPGLKQQGQLHFASPFFSVVSSLVASFSEGEHCWVSTCMDENVTACFMPHLDSLFFSAGEGGGSYRRVDAIFILHQQRKKFLVRAPNHFIYLFFACHPKPLGTEFNHICDSRKKTYFFAPSDSWSACIIAQVESGWPVGT